MLYPVDTIEDWFGFDVHIKTVEKFISEYGNSYIPKLLIITGPPGTGKTSLVYAVSKKLNFRVIEYNGSMELNRKNISQVFNVTNTLDDIKNIILIDEADFITTRMSLKKFIDKSLTPIIFTCNYVYMINTELLDTAWLITFEYPSDEKKEEYARNMTKKLSINITEKDLLNIIKKNVSYRGIMMSILSGSIELQSEIRWYNNYKDIVHARLVNGSKDTNLDTKDIVNYMINGSNNAIINKDNVYLYLRLEKIKKVIGSIATVTQSYICTSNYAITRKKKKLKSTKIIDDKEDDININKIVSKLKHKDVESRKFTESKKGSLYNYM